MLGSFASLSGAFVATSSSAMFERNEAKPAVGIDERRCSCLREYRVADKYGKCKKVGPKHEISVCM